MTPNTIIQLALKLAGVIGVGQAPQQQDLDDAFALLNMMMGQWSQKRYLVYHELDVSSIGTGAQAYSVGVGGNFNTPRPDQILSAFARMNAGTANPIDYPLEVIDARETYNLLPYKSQHGMPQSVFYDATFPVGTLYFNPVPGSMYELHIAVKSALTGFATLNDDIALPTQYQEALLYNLAARLAPMYQVSPNPVTVALAKASLNTIRNSNSQIATLSMPAGLPGMGRRGLGSQYFGGGASVPIPTPDMSGLLDTIGLPDTPGSASAGWNGGTSIGLIGG